MVNIDEWKKIGEGFRSRSYISDDGYILLEGVNEKSFETYVKDKRVLDFLSNKITSTNIPKDIDLIPPSHDTLEFGGERYKGIEGKVLDIDNIHSYSLDSIAKDLASFLNELHGIDIYGFNKDFKKEEYIKNEKEVVDRNINLLVNYFDKKKLYDWREIYFNLLDNTNRFTIIHGDFWYENYIISRDGKRLKGVIDFENCDIGIPVMDFVPLLYISEEFFKKVLSFYNFSNSFDEYINIFSQRREIVSYEYITMYCDLDEQKEQREKIEGILSIV
ncbi:MAG: aminoglycoside phosphotransferase family protein [Candidatus Dojkabacteria bacterium]|nr:aminoglycoside phosphotransferase family protein [Candidatus Dojkabacteria bacterium]